MTEILAWTKLIVQCIMLVLMFGYWRRYDEAKRTGRVGDQLDALGWMIFTAIVAYA